MDWTNEQREIVEAPAGVRLIVEAGPGTGKTAVACGRVAKLLGEDITPSAILMVSFTRTAVAEMKNRIAQWASAGRTGAVNICTLDQAAFTFGIGCGQKFEKLMGSFTGNIRSVLEHFKSQNALLLDYMQSFQHLIIDEAQDLTGDRSRLATYLIEFLAADAGITIFGDPNQAIYGFSDSNEGAPAPAGPFLQSFDLTEYRFNTRELTKIHRTDYPPLLQLFGNSRKALSGRATGVERVQDVIRAAEETGPCAGDNVVELGVRNGDLLLYRKRASALMHAMFCPRLFRLRLPGLPPAIFPWLGLTLFDCAEPMLTELEFVRLWAERVPSGLEDGFTDGTAWALLHRFAGRRADVDLCRLRKLLSNSRPRVEFCQLDYGATGPVFGTIHASKGREADRVFLMLPRNLDYLERGEKLDPEEEARVYYVGATRVRKEFFRGKAHSLPGSQRLEERSERLIQLLAETKLKFQVGLTRDFDDLAAVSRDSFLCASTMAAAAHQQHLVTLWRRCVEQDTPGAVQAHCVPRPDGSGWPWSFRDDEDHLLAWGGENFGRDLWSMNRLVQERFKGTRRPSRTIRHLRLIGLRTRVLAEDDPGLGAVHKPYANSGFLLAPMIVGFQPVYFNKRKPSS